MQTAADTILMVRPIHFHYNSETAVNNYYQHRIGGLGDPEAQARAAAEFENFVSTLEAAGVRVIVVPDTEGSDTPDSIFPNNWISFHPNGAVILYPMYAENRRRERRMDILDMLETDYNFHIDQIIDLSYHEAEGDFLEGTGSIVLDRVHKIAYAAISPRTSERVLDEFCRKTGYRVVKFTAYQSVDGQRLPIYHTNVMMCVGSNFAVLCADCIDDELERESVINALEQSGKEIIFITEAQVMQFAGNMLEVSATGDPGSSLIVMSAAAYNSLTEEQKNQLGKHAELLYSPLDTIEALGGGSARCMMAEVFLPKNK